MVGSKQPTPVWLSPEEADRVSLDISLLRVRLVHVVCVL